MRSRAAASPSRSSARSASGSIARPRCARSSGRVTLATPCRARWTRSPRRCPVRGAAVTRRRWSARSPASNRRASAAMATRAWSRDVGPIRLRHRLRARAPQGSREGVPIRIARRVRRVGRAHRIVRRRQQANPRVPRALPRRRLVDRRGHALRVRSRHRRMRRRRRGGVRRDSGARDRSARAVRRERLLGVRSRRRRRPQP